jgi:spore coat polysaccharide biosynthesis protein SpsF
VSGHSVIAIVQARMSSRRFPGKVLTPFKGRAILEHVLTAVEQVLPPANVLIATSVESSDDAIVDFAAARGTRVFRGDLANVLARFQDAAKPQKDVEWILRVNADSPLLDAEVLHHVLAARGPDVDVVTTTQPRTFPKGRNAELMRRMLLLRINAAAVTSEEREHVTSFFYNRPRKFRIRNVESGHPEWANVSFAVDTPEDLTRLERLSDAELARFSLTTT